MEAKLVRAPNSPVLIVAGLALLFLGAMGVERAAAEEAVALHYRIPIWVLTGSAIRNAIFGIALLYVALRRSRFAGVTAAIIAAFLTFVVLSNRVINLVTFASLRASWWDAVYLVIAGAIIGSSLFPWSPNANKPVLIWIGGTFAALTLLLSSVAVLARL